MSNKPIAGVATPDPWMVAANGIFYLTFTLGNRVSIWSSPNMEDFHNPKRCVVWHPPKDAPWSTHVWAPELHWLDGKWYIYVAAAQPGTGNKGHRTVVLRSSNQDPMVQSAWEFLGPVKGMPENFSIDATAFTPNGRDLYLCWSGWPPGDGSDSTQNLYISQMVSPEEVVDWKVMPPVCISQPDQPWERFDGGKRGINEGPTWLNLPNGAFTGIVYSGHASFTSEYKLGLLRLVSPTADPLNPHSWQKRMAPLLINDQSMPGPYAPGHASFLPSPYPGDQRVFCIYHGTDNWGEGFKNRKGRVIALGFETFGGNARPVCCSNAPNNPFWNGGAAGHGAGARPQSLLPPQASQKIDQYAHKAPAPVQKVMNKFKKYL